MEGIKNFFSGKNKDAKDAVKKTFATGAFIAVTTTGLANNEGRNEGGKEKEIKTETFTQKDTSEQKQNQKGTLEVYTKAKTREGGITPTGLSNSFLENEYGITVEDIDSVATKYGFPTTSQEDFQSAMYDYVEKYKPGLINALLEKYGQTKAGKLRDGFLGARDAFCVKELLEDGTPEKKVNPYERWGGQREPLYFDDRIAAELWYPTVETHSASKQGQINSNEGKVLVRTRDDHGYKKDYVVDANKLQLFLGTTNQFQTLKKLENFLQEASVSLDGATAHYYDGLSKN